MVSLSIVCPAPNAVVPAGQTGAIVAQVDAEGVMEIPGDVLFKLTTVGGAVVSEQTADIHDGQAVAECRWPGTPGVYTIEAECQGLLYGTLATATVTFSAAGAMGPAATG